MPFEPLRFLHASDVRLDHSLAETAPLPPRTASILIDATHAAFERLLSAAIEHVVDFLLLSGNTFIEAERSLPARLALLAGFEQLAQEQIGVFVVPGPLDPPEAWRLISSLPKNVTVLQPRQRAGVPVKRDDKVIAVIGASPRFAHRKAPSPHRELRSEAQRPVPFVIGALPSGRDLDTLAGEDQLPPDRIEGTDATSSLESAPRRERSNAVETDYLALGGGVRRTITNTRGIAHDPGTIQGISLSESGPRGATLVTVETDGTVRCDFVPTASVRWERFTMAVHTQTQRSDLVRRCRAALEESRWESTENAWLVEWVLSGPADALQRLHDASLLPYLRQELDASGVMPNSETAVHTIVQEADLVAAGFDADGLHTQFLSTLGSGQSNRDRSRTVDGLGDDEWMLRLHALHDELDPHAIEVHAHRMGAVLFGAGGLGPALFDPVVEGSAR